MGTLVESLFEDAQKEPREWVIPFLNGLTDHQDRSPEMIRILDQFRPSLIDYIREDLIKNIEYLDTSDQDTVDRVEMMDTLWSRIIEYREMGDGDDEEMRKALETLADDLRMEGLEEENLKARILMSLFSRGIDVDPLLMKFASMVIKKKGKEGLDNVLSMLDRFGIEYRSNSAIQGA